MAEPQFDPSKSFTVAPPFDPSQAFTVAPIEPVVAGTIDLRYRPRVKNPDGSVSTIRSIGVEEDGKEVLIPTVIGGKIVSDDAAIAHYKRTGQHLGKFASVDDANAFAQKLHDDEEAGRGSKPAVTVHQPPLKEPTTYAGGFIRSVGDTVGRTVKGAAEGVLSVVDPRTYVGLAKTGAGLFTDPVGTSVRAGEVIVDEAGRVVSGDPEAGGRVIGQLTTALVAPRVVPEVPGYIQRARDYAASLPKPGLDTAAKAVKFVAHPVRSTAQAVADVVAAKLESAANQATPATVPPPSPSAAEPVAPIAATSETPIELTRRIKAEYRAQQAATPSPSAAEPIVPASGRMKLTGPEFAEWQRLVKNGQSMPDAYATIQAQRGITSPAETVSGGTPPQPGPPLESSPASATTNPPHPTRTVGQMSPSAIQSDLGIAARRAGVSLPPGSPQAAKAEALVRQGLSIEEAVAEAGIPAKETLTANAAGSEYQRLRLKGLTDTQARDAIAAALQMQKTAGTMTDAQRIAAQDARYLRGEVKTPSAETARARRAAGKARTASVLEMQIPTENGMQSVGSIVAEMQKAGTPQAQIDRWLQGLERLARP